MKARASTTSAMVSRAIGEIVHDDLPTAIQATMVADVIVRQLLEDMGLPDAPRQMRRAFLDVAVEELMAGQLRAGCQRYTQETGRPHVPVTAYFFSNVYTDDSNDLRACIERGAITKEEVKQSLPRRSCYAKLHDGSVDRDTVIDNSTDGFVIFAPMSDSPLLLVWMSRLRGTAMRSTATRIHNIAKAVKPSAIPAIDGTVAALDHIVPHPDEPEYSSN